MYFRIVDRESNSLSTYRIIDYPRISGYGLIPFPMSGWYTLREIDSGVIIGQLYQANLGTA